MHVFLQEEKSWRSTQDDLGHLTEKPRANVWRVENAGATFLVCSPEHGSPAGMYSLPLIFINMWLLSASDASHPNLLSPVRDGEEVCELL